MIGAGGSNGSSWSSESRVEDGTHHKSVHTVAAQGCINGALTNMTEDDCRCHACDTVERADWRGRPSGDPTHVPPDTRSHLGARINILFARINLVKMFCENYSFYVLFFFLSVFSFFLLICFVMRFLCFFFWFFCVCF